jgi:hypothetical protein
VPNLIRDDEVVGSNPATPTQIRACPSMKRRCCGRTCAGPSSPYAPVASRLHTQRPTAQAGGELRLVGTPETYADSLATGRAVRSVMGLNSGIRNQVRTASPVRNRLTCKVTADTDSERDPLRSGTALQKMTIGLASDTTSGYRICNRA